MKSTIHVTNANSRNYYNVVGAIIDSTRRLEVAPIDVFVDWDATFTYECAADNVMKLAAELVGIESDVKSFRIGDCVVIYTEFEN